MLDISVTSKNNVAIVGTLMSLSVREGKTVKTGDPYKSATAVIRVVQNHGGRTETNEIEVSSFATKTTSKGKINPVYENIERLEQLRTAQSWNLAEADKVKIDDRASLQENVFYSPRGGDLSSTWKIRHSFMNKATSADPEIATFSSDIFILEITDETNRELEPTGRKIIKGALINWGGKANVVKYFVENADLINFIESNWEVNQTWNVRGRIRALTVAENRTEDSGIGESVPQTYTRSVRELVISWCDREMLPEDECHELEAMKIAMAERKAVNEQIFADGEAKAKSGVAKKTTPASKTVSSDYDWGTN